MSYKKDLEIFKRQYLKKLSSGLEKSHIDKLLHIYNVSDISDIKLDNIEHAIFLCEKTLNELVDTISLLDLTTALSNNIKILSDNVLSIDDAQDDIDLYSDMLLNISELYEKASNSERKELYKTLISQIHTYELLIASKK